VTTLGHYSCESDIIATQKIKENNNNASKIQVTRVLAISESNKIQIKKIKKNSGKKSFGHM